MIKIMIKRKAPREKETELLSLITRLRSAASQQPGYISGETLHGTDKPEDYLVISIWETDASSGRIDVARAASTAIASTYG